jgi:hypothetical protein
MRPFSLLLILLMTSLFAACTPASGSVEDGPVLVRQVTVVPTDLMPTRFLSPTPVRVTPEVLSPLDQVTVDAQFVIVTPTLPPSKTPTTTPTFTPTLTYTPTPTTTNTATATTFLLPTSEFVVITQPVAAPNNRICDSNWFFIQPRPESCPLYPPNASPGVYQEFQNGYMVWVGSQDAIYILYNDAGQPRWEVKRDYFLEGMPESAPEYDSAPASTLWQPRRGFGWLWRADAAVRSRIGWATQQWEEPFSVQVQTGNDGSVFISTPRSAVFVVFPNGLSWDRYLTGGSISGPTGSGGLGTVTDITPLAPIGAPGG